MRKLVTFESLHVEQEGAVAGSSVFGIGKGEPFPVGGPTEGRGNSVGYVGGDEFAFRPAQRGHNIDASCRQQPGDERQSACRRETTSN